MSERSCVSVCACVHLSTYPDPGLTAFFACVFLHSSKCAAWIPGHLQKQRESDCWAQEIVWSERRLPKKRVGEDGKLKGLDVPQNPPTPRQQPWITGRTFVMETSRLHCKHNVLHWHEFLYSENLCLSWCFVCFLGMENECWVNCVYTPYSSSWQRCWCLTMRFLLILSGSLNNSAEGFFSDVTVQQTYHSYINDVYSPWMNKTMWPKTYILWNETLFYGGKWNKEGSCADRGRRMCDWYADMMTDVLYSSVLS